ncbi:conserved hypothetical protein [Dehalogenimonas lykanthroporepellens BL-DC-9]|nr:conserved hypothetical protein [Dehalogenimonas lykanthroporepellens BL-DC-9]
MEQTQTEEGFVSFDSHPENETPETPDIEAVSLTLAERDAAIDRLTTERDQALEAYRAAAVALNPELPAELITGSNIAEVDSAVTRARALVDRVKAGLKPATPPSPVAVPRAAATGPLSPADKIRRGLEL